MTPLFARKRLHAPLEKLQWIERWSTDSLLSPQRGHESEISSKKFPVLPRTSIVDTAPETASQKNASKVGRAKPTHTKEVERPTAGTTSKHLAKELEEKMPDGHDFQIQRSIAFLQIKKLESRPKNYEHGKSCTKGEDGFGGVTIVQGTQFERESEKMSTITTKGTRFLCGSAKEAYIHVSRKNIFYCFIWSTYTAWIRYG